MLGRPHLFSCLLLLRPNDPLIAGTDLVHKRRGRPRTRRKKPVAIKALNQPLRFILRIGPDQKRSRSILRHVYYPLDVRGSSGEFLVADAGAQRKIVPKRDTCALRVPVHPTTLWSQGGTSSAIVAQPAASALLKVVVWPVLCVREFRGLQNAVSDLDLGRTLRLHDDDWDSGKESN